MHALVGYGAVFRLGRRDEFVGNIPLDLAGDVTGDAGGLSVLGGVRW
ncbi:hypothetical protein GCM10009716_07660 [Streptomyces sodiiphilus]|uniref:Uncharacterized protein n=1 Tax=Streptomyces sodiiphilus TaxID=226217 RepID=A0ABP5A254_9ACTN